MLPRWLYVALMWLDERSLRWRWVEWLNRHVIDRRAMNEPEPETRWWERSFAVHVLQRWTVDLALDACKALKRVMGR